MVSLHRKWRAALVAFLLAALPVAAASASPATAPLDAAGAVGEWLGEWADGWLTWLLPGRATVAAEAAASAEPPTGVAPGDESLLGTGCDESICTEGESLPDFDPDGDD